ncbi:MAG: DegT/DnrJ/EryC1/StrS family aminotransferase, partial [Planctomycetales bacterium]|nr:DegT/DnrJ/EryC1/StrS family aminotransferase [Planctomycetales bacterium]
RLRLLRGQAVSPERCYWHNEVGYNYRMTNVAAAIGCAQMERIDAHLERRQQVAAWYNELLNDRQDLFQLPTVDPSAHHCFWMYSIVMRDREIVRDNVIRSLAQRGIETRPIFYPVHWMPPYQESVGSYPVAEQLSSSGISLPTHGKLTRDDVAYVADQLTATIIEQQQATTPVRRAA